MNRPLTSEAGPACTWQTGFARYQRDRSAKRRYGLICLEGLPSAAARALIVAYRIMVSPIIVSIAGPACRFQPTCSSYANQALALHGIIQGGWMALRRLSRCRPFGGSGYDPVPVRCAGRGHPSERNPVTVILQESPRRRMRHRDRKSIRNSVGQ